MKTSNSNIVQKDILPKTVEFLYETFYIEKYIKDLGKDLGNLKLTSQS